MYCSFCGKEIPDKSTFCGYCGKKLVYRGEGGDDAPDGALYDGGYEQELDPWFVTPSWGYYEEDWEDEADDVSAADELLGDEAASGLFEAEEEATSDEDDAADMIAAAIGAADRTDVVDCESEGSPEGAASVDNSHEDGEAAGSDGSDDPDAARDPRGSEGEMAFGPVRPAMRPLSKDAFVDAAAGGVYVPGMTAPRKRGLAAPAVVGIAAAALIVGAAGTFALTGPFSSLWGQPAGEEPPAVSQPAANGSSETPADQAPAGDGNAAVNGAAPGQAAGDSPAPAPADDAAVETGFKSAKKLVAALETPLFDALGDNFSRPSMRLLVLDELDFMVPAYAEALAREAGFASVREYARSAKDTEAEQFGTYAGTWSFKLERGKKCSARTVERIERSCQLVGAEVTIDKAYKIEAVTSSYPSDYDSKNVDDQGMYHKVTPYTAIQVDGRWYLYADALAAEKSDDKSDKEE